MTTNTFVEQFAAARLVSVPIVTVSTADQMDVVATLAKENDKFALVLWDAARGCTALNKLAEQMLTKHQITADDTHGFADAMVAVERLERGAIVFALNAHRQLQSQDPGSTAVNVQTVANLRDTFKLNWRMLVLCGPDMSVPAELKNDVVPLTDELPNAEALQKTVREIYASAREKAPQLQDPDAAEMDKAVDAISGLSSFAAEQVVALSMTETGLDKGSLWRLKRTTVDQTPGLTLASAPGAPIVTVAGLPPAARGLDRLRGLESFKARLRSHITARTPIGVVVRIDEGADVFAALDGGGDSNGVKTDQQRALLIAMEEEGWPGVIGVGVPGVGKSDIARAFAEEAGVPGLEVDFGALESKWQGESEANVRHMINVIKAMGRGHAFFMLTCNTLRGIRPQFMRRFKRGVFFFDLPTAEEREAIWQLYETRYSLTGQPRPDDDGWTGAEIKECCESAWDTHCTLQQAAQFIIPVSRSRAKDIEQMRQEAHERFLDASRPGAYVYNPTPMAEQVRAIQLPTGPQAFSKPGRKIN